jgi:hypothetical protein
MRIVINQNLFSIRLLIREYVEISKFLSQGLFSLFNHLAIKLLILIGFPLKFP